MKTLYLLLPALAVLSACNSKPTVSAENASVEDVAAAAKEAVKMKPGKWETTVKILSIDAPNMPPQFAEAMTKQANTSHTAQTCVTPAMADKPPENMFAGAAKNCKYEKFEIRGGKIDGTLVCPAGDGMPGGMRGTIAGTMSDTAFDITSDTTVTMAAMPGAPTKGENKMTSKTQVSAKRIGECDATPAAK